VPNSTTHTDTGSEHRLRTPPTSSQQFYNLLYNKFTTNGKKFATPQHLDMSRCWTLALRCGKFVVELLWACPLVVSVGGVVQHVRNRCPCSGVWPLLCYHFQKLVRRYGVRGAAYDYEGRLTSSRTVALFLPCWRSLPVFESDCTVNLADASNRILDLPFYGSEWVK